MGAPVWLIALAAALILLCAAVQAICSSSCRCCSSTRPASPPPPLRPATGAAGRSPFAVAAVGDDVAVGDGEMPCPCEEGWAGSAAAAGGPSPGDG